MRSRGFAGGEPVAVGRRPIGLAVLLALAVAGCGSHASQPTGGAAAPSASGAPTAAPSSSPQGVPVHVIGRGTAFKPSIITDTKNGRKIYTIRTMLFEGDIAAGTAVLDQPHVTFVDKTGAVTIADAPKATVSQHDKSVLMTGGVHARTQDGAVLTCDTLRYDSSRERLFGEGHVVMTGPNGLSLTGDHLDGDVRLHDVKVTSG
ncbi:MAG TPA: LPS export ABC transporter periplasmic protein LptC [Candidatus Sulfotelmatobacter sp.]|nr:LPS export ABC transporter periplasmic protein LptC [Candidatus Sulfotelmatobacter sp.]